MNRLWITLALLCALAARTAAAGPFGDKPIVFIVPYPAGGTTDVIARKWAEELGRKLHTPVIVENVAGAGGSIGAKRVAVAPADGYTLLVGSVNELVLTPLSQKKPLYKSGDFRAVIINYASPVVLLANNQRPFKTMSELVAAGKTGHLAFGTPGPGTFHHLVLHTIAQRGGIDMLHVPYKGGAPFINDVLAGQIDLIVLPVVSAAPYATTGRLRALGVSSASRSEALPGVPTFAESAPEFKGLDMTIWAGIFAPAATPTPVIDRLNAALREVYQTESIQAFVRAGGSRIPASALDPFGAQRFVDAEERRYRAIVPTMKLED